MHLNKLLQLLELLNDDQPETTKDGNIKLRTEDGTFVGSFGTEGFIIFLEKFKSIKIEDIFSGLCPKERYKDNNDCIVCDTKFNMFTIRKHW